MVKKLLLCFLFTHCLNLFAQTNSKLIYGLVESETKPLENIHVYNKTKGNGAITNSKGAFKIYVSKNDTLIFSGIQFYYVEHKVTEEIFINNYLRVSLLLRINELKEVQIKTNNLLGSLSLDASNVLDADSKIAPEALDFSKIDFKKPFNETIDEIDRLKPPDISHLVMPGQFGLKGSIGLKRLRTKEEKKLLKLEATAATNDKIKMLLSESFFTNILNIPLEKIDPFLDFCKPKGIEDLYKQNKKLALIEILINESKKFKL